MTYESGKYYHVYNRGANKQNIFLQDENYRFCFERFTEYSAKHHISIIAYCLMPNHYHLLVRQNIGGSTSKFIQSVFNSYTQAFNKVTGHSGTLFQGKAKGKVIDSDMYAVHVCRYIHFNPYVAALVNHPQEWEYSDFLEWTGKRNNGLTDLVLRNGYFMSAEGYERFAEENVAEDSLKKFLFDE